MGVLLYEMRLTVRRLLKDPFRASVSVVALTLGIGLTASMFSIAYTILFRGMPFEHSDELMAVELRNPETGVLRSSLPLLDFRELEDRQTAFADVAAWTTAWHDLADDEGRPERAPAALLSASFFATTGEAPILGRAFGPADVGPDAAVVLIGHRLWQDRFGGDPGVLGRALRLDGRSFTIIGVMGPDFTFPQNQNHWVPMPWDEATVGPGEAWVRLLGRLPEGVGEEVARAEVDAILARLAEERGDTDVRRQAELVPLVYSFLGGEEISLLKAMIAASLLVLAIACVNVANLLTAVAVDRSRDLAVSTALGASRARVLGQLLSEAVLLSLVGGTLGVGLSMWFVEWFDRTLGAHKPLWMRFEIDGPILGFALGVSLLAAVLAGLTPALRASSVSVREVLQDEGRGASGRRLGRISRGMVVATMALAYPLLVGAGLLLMSYRERLQDTAFQRDDVLLVRILLPSRQYPDAARRLAFVDEMLLWAEGRAEVLEETWSDWLPSLEAPLRSVELEGASYQRDADRPEARLAVIRPGYFRALGVDVLRGRAFDARDRSGTPAVLVNEPFVERHFAGEDPLGRRLRVGGPDAEWRVVVGVVPDLRMNGTDQTGREGIYVPSPPADLAFGYFLFRTRGDPLRVAPAVRSRIATADPELPIHSMETLDERIEGTYWVLDLIGPIFTTFGAAALFLSSVGLFGVVGHSVARRTREMGVRTALGATRGRILWLVLRSGLGQALVGVALGSGLAFYFSRLLAGALLGVRPGDPATMVLVGGVLVLAAFLAVLWPGLRAMALKPVEALRVE